MTDNQRRGLRVTEVRRALGDPRKPLSQNAFAELLAKKAKRPYHTSAISLMERGKQALTLADIDVIAKVDPKKRGRVWLACYEADIPMVPRDDEEGSSGPQIVRTKYEVRGTHEERDEGTG